MACLGRRSNRK